MAKRDINADIGGNVKKSISFQEKLSMEAEKRLAKYKEKLSDEFYSKEFKKREEATKKYLKKEKQLEQENAELLRKEEFLERLDEEKRFQRKKKEIEKEYREAQKSETRKWLEDTAGKMAKAFTNAAEKGFEAYTKYYSTFSARLQNSALNVSDIYRTAQNASISPYVKITSLLESTNALLTAGITNNLTQRAFLDAISDKIATTFSATQDSLIEITRIQKQDTTASRLGLEAYLTRMFNSYFGDTSYLAQQFDAVQGILIGTSAQLGAQQGIAFEYQVQKWLGALGASGVSGATLQQIAQGINYLGTGNITALSGNQSLQNLLLMGATRGGVSYTDVLTQGMTATDANKILYGIVDYIRSISGNNVVRAQYAELFGISLTDMKVISDMTASTIRDLTKSAMTYSDTLDELDYQLSQVSSRMHLSEKIENVMENILVSTGMEVASNAALYGTYRAAQMLESVTGGIPIPTPFVNVGTFEQAIKTGIMGIGLLGPLMGGLNALQNGGSLNYRSYAIDTSGRETGFRQVGRGQLLGTTSGTTFMYNETKSGTQQAIYDEQQQEAERISGEDSANDTLAILRAIRDYLQGGSSSWPLHVQMENYGLGISAVTD